MTLSVVLVALTQSTNRQSIKRWPKLITSTPPKNSVLKELTRPSTPSAASAAFQENIPYMERNVLIYHSAIAVAVAIFIFFYFIYVDWLNE